MDKATVLRALLKARPQLQAEGVTHVWLFGSVARDEATEASDVDLFFDHDIPRFGVLEYVGLKQTAQEALPFKVDFIARSSLHRDLRPAIEASAEQVF